AEKALTAFDDFVGPTVATPVTVNQQPAISWNFDDGNASDLTGNGLDGQLGGDAAIVDADPRGLGSGLFQKRISDVGPFDITGIPKGEGYRVYAFLDANGNGKFERSEPSGFADGTVDLSNSIDVIQIALSEPPIIVQAPVETEARVGGAAELSVVAAGTAPFSYQWFFNNEPLTDTGNVTGSTTATLKLADIASEDFGIYTVEVSNALGSVVAGGPLVEQVTGFPITGSVTYDGPVGRPGDKALALDGDGDFVETTLTDLSGSELTIQYWFKGSSLQSAVRQQSGGWVVAGWNNLHILSHDGGVDGVAIGEGAVDGEWHHVALTWKQGTTNGFASYVDGQLVAARDSIDEPIPAHDAALYFGAFNGVGEFSNGMLDEISVWNRALSAAEIASNYKNGLGGDEEGLLGYWNFDDGTAADLSPGGHDGTLGGDASIVESPLRAGAGTVYVQTSVTKQNNRTLCVDGVDGHAVVDTLTNLSGSEITIQYWFKGESIQSSVRQQAGGWIVSGWNGLHILSNDGGVGGISAGENVTDGN
ncbi:MAG: LamG-like jellyroll fold domain-containing protein, partial [Verrucomicrobiota bacterium]